MVIPKDLAQVVGAIWVNFDDDDAGPKCCERLHDRAADTCSAASHKSYFAVEPD